jgi:DNA-binding NarL/FixJ family response regulator
MKINILLADDNLEKLDSIKLLIKDNFDECELGIAHSYNSTIKIIKKEKFDLLLLDMSMPTFDQKVGTSAPIKPLAGRDVLSKLKYKKNPLKVIVITQFDIFGRMSDTIDLQDLELNLKDNYGSNFVGCIYYDPRGSSWSENLITLIKDVVSFE